MGGPALPTLPRRVLVAALAPLLQALLVVLMLASLVFLSVRLLPGDPTTLVLGDDASASERASVRAALHFDESLPVQYARFLGGLVRLDLGDSLRRPGVSAMARVGASLVPTSALAATAVLLGATLGVAAALLACGPWLGRGRALVDALLVVGSATPLLAFAPLATYALGVRVHLVPLPADPDAGPAGLLFAASLLAIPLAAGVGRVSRAALASAGASPFIQVARAKGVAELRVWVVHALPVATGPIVTVVSTQLGALLGGAVVLERLFERQGLGTLILEAYASRDVPVLEGAVVAAGAIFVVSQALGAMVHASIDPRTRA